jgi:hypothetical protein
MGKTSGKYFYEKQPIESSPATRDRDAAAKLWSLSLDLTHLEDFRGSALQLMGRSAAVPQ